MRSCPLQRDDFVELLDRHGRAADDDPAARPAAARVPARPCTDLMVRVALAEERGEVDDSDVRLLAAVSRLHESNPMLGLRGVRLGLAVPGLFALQVRAIAEAAAERIQAGAHPQAGDHGPARRLGDGAAPHPRRDRRHRRRSRATRRASSSTIPLGTMIELPRAALTAHRIAEAAEFFSFGTNDLTQTTWGFSRDDVEAEFFAAYLDKGVFTQSRRSSRSTSTGSAGSSRSPSAEGRAARPNLHLGVCGEHGGDPDSIHFFHGVGLDYVSCSPFRVPIARLEAGRAALGSVAAESR